MTEAALVRRGRCHLLGDHVSLDQDIIPARFARERVTDPEQLKPHLFATIDPDLAARIRPGDFVLAGKNFACGKPRVQGFLAMGDLQLSVLCGSMPYKMLRRAVARGIPVITGVDNLAQFASDGDEIEVDFASGQIRNLSQNEQMQAGPMPPSLLEIVSAGGMQAILKDWLARHPEQAEEPLGFSKG